MVYSIDQKVQNKLSIIVDEVDSILIDEAWFTINNFWSY